MLVSKIYVFCKIVKGLSPRYLTKYVNLRSFSNYQTSSANKNNLQEFSCGTESFKHSFFPFCFREWNKLENTLRDAESIKQFTTALLRSTVLPFTAALLNLLSSSLLHSFNQQSLNSGSVQVQTLLVACRRFAIVRISDSGPGQK